MKTLIELYDERPLENVLATEVFRPETTVFLCPTGTAYDKQIKGKMNSFFSKRGVNTKIVFKPVDMYNAKSIQKCLCETVKEYPDCALDITGGTNDALFAAGMLCAETSVPVFTYSRKKNSFFEINNAGFAEMKCAVSYGVEDCILMAGGALKQGRVDNSILSNYMDIIDPFFEVYRKNRNSWVSAVSFIQQISGREYSNELRVQGQYIQKGERGKKIEAPAAILSGCAKIGMLKDLMIDPDKGVRFEFADENVRAWLRDIGAVLELYVYKACIDTGVFNNVISSAVVDWEGEPGKTGVTNEIDVVATSGVIPAFISCKTCDVKTEALNELSILRDRFGGEMATAALVTTRYTQAITRRRAMELGIDLIDLNDITKGNLPARLKRLSVKNIKTNNK